MQDTMNAHDLDAFADCFSEDFASIVPLHPDRSFDGQAQMRANWSGLFGHVPDLVGTVQQSVVDGDQVWSEWEISGTTVEQQPYLSRGVAILHITSDKIDSVRFYLDDVG